MFDLKNVCIFSSYAECVKSDFKVRQEKKQTIFSISERQYLHATVDKMYANKGRLKAQLLQHIKDKK